MLNLVWVQTFLAVLETGSFQAAANQLGMAQPTVSQHIQKLEEQLGVLLVRRARTGCEPTSAAVALLPYAQSLIRLNGRALAAVKGDHLRVGASSNVGIYLLQPKLKTFLEGRQRSQFDVVIDRNPTIAEKLASGEVDVAVMEWWDNRPGFKAQIWRSEPVILITSPSHPLAGRAEASARDLAGLELLGGEAGSGTARLIAAYFAGSGAMPRVSLQLGSTEAVKQAVRAGVGISLVLRCAVTEEVRNGTLRAVPLAQPSMHKDIFVIWRDNGVRHLPDPPFVQHLLGMEGAVAVA